MSPRDLLIELGSRGVRIWVKGEELHYRAPRGSLTLELQKAMALNKAVLMERLRSEEQILQMNLEEFRKGRWAVEVRVSGMSNTLWFVSGDIQADTLEEGAVRRGQIWTAAELRELWRGSGLGHDDVMKIAQVKLAFDAEVSHRN